MPRVLVIDDDPRVGRDLRALLEPLGYEVSVAVGEADALMASATMALTRVRPHVVVIDLQFLEPFHDGDRRGLDLLRNRLLECAGRIVYSGHLDTLPVMRLAMEGADAVVGKGEPPQDLLAAIRRVAHRKCGHGSTFHVTWPEAWTPARVMKALFSDEHGVPESLTADVIWGVFDAGESVELVPLDGADGTLETQSRSRSVVFEARPRGLQPVLV
jgi:DNA-binding NarL/FixJ family response regulator